MGCVPPRQTKWIHILASFSVFPCIVSEPLLDPCPEKQRNQVSIKSSWTVLRISSQFMTGFGRIWQLKKKTIEQNGTWKYYVLYLSFKRFKKKINRKSVSVQVFSIAVLIGDTEKSLKYCKLNRNFVNKTQAGWRLICWLFTKRKGVGFRITTHKSI